ncbi:GCR1-dependent translation factor 1 [Coemansia javaensis]|uniref:GDT1 family protein n=1 Tax=Coemansia javaensis TaxID=2761396 RepID=A0A9W8H4F9_9FUNG|nr:GCR1-dependent translation factor 1 [Coemansia javaensis]
MALFPGPATTEAFAATDGGGAMAATALGLGGQSDSLVASILMIFVSEIGDKTFLIAAILAMSNPRSTIFIAACSALWLMSILSAFLGHAVVTFIPMSWVSLAAAAMFLVFGVRLLLEARGMDGSEIAKEMHSVESELSEKDEARRQLALESGVPAAEKGAPAAAAAAAAAGEEDFSVNVGSHPDDADGGAAIAAPARAAPAAGSTLDSLKNLLGLLLSPIFVETFVLVFLAEWGDRSQLATIALGAARNVYGVAAGTILGHTCCTGLAVMGGRLLASRISVKKVTYAGGALFIVFALAYTYEVMCPAESAA